MIDVRFDDEAEAELLDALEWYEEKGEGLGWRLLLAVDETVGRIASTPGAYAAVPLVRTAVARRAPVAGFPYALVYLEHDGEIRIVAVAHAKRRPGYWLARLRR